MKRLLCTFNKSVNETCSSWRLCKTTPTLLGAIIKDHWMMVLYRVHSEFQAEKFYSTVCSRATLFQVIIYSLMIVPPFFIAYATNGNVFPIRAHHHVAPLRTACNCICFESSELWQYTSSYREQPRVDYLNRLIVQISDRQSYNGSSIWSSFSNLDQLLELDELATPTIKVIIKNVQMYI